MWTGILNFGIKVDHGNFFYKMGAATVQLTRKWIIQHVPRRVCNWFSGFHRTFKVVSWMQTEHRYSTTTCLSSSWQNRTRVFGRKWNVYLNKITFYFFTNFMTFTFECIRLWFLTNNMWNHSTIKSIVHKTWNLFVRYPHQVLKTAHLWKLRVQMIYGLHKDLCNTFILP